MKSIRLAGAATPEEVSQGRELVGPVRRLLGTRCKEDQASFRLSGFAPPSQVARHNWDGFGRPLFIQVLIDLGAVIVSAFIICATAFSIPLMLFLLFFCEL